MDELNNDISINKTYMDEQFNNINQILINNQQINDNQIRMMSSILDKIENVEKTYVSMNTDLINQNIKMCELLKGKLPEPDFEIQKDNNSGSNNVKELFYFENQGLFIVYGPGTYDNKHKLKDIGNWNSFNKTWDLTITKEELLEQFPTIIEKEK